MSKKCDAPKNMKFGMGDPTPKTTQVKDKPVQLQAYGLPDGVTVNVIRSETDDPSGKGGACYDYCAPAIDPCTGESAAMTAAAPVAILNAAGLYKLEIEGAEWEDIDETVGIFCYEIAGDTSLLLKKADEAGLTAEDAKVIVEGCISPLEDRITQNEDDIANIPPDTDTTYTLSGFTPTGNPNEFEAALTGSDGSTSTSTITLSAGSTYNAATQTITTSDGNSVTLSPDDDITAVTGSTVNPDGEATITVGEGATSFTGTIQCVQPALALKDGSPAPKGTRVIATDDQPIVDVDCGPLDMCFTRCLPDGTTEEVTLTIREQPRSGTIVRSQVEFFAADLPVDAVVMQSTAPITFSTDKRNNRYRVEMNYTYRVLTEGDFDEGTSINLREQYRILDAAGAEVVAWTDLANTGGVDSINVSDRQISETSTGPAWDITPTLPAGSDYRLEFRVRVQDNTATGPYRVTFGTGEGWINQFRLLC